eukprot:TRINITY_DN120887_c0_g1_i1.p1 TRINITY_DN120887_c0_g1~~TRINITY_DN120887_c0_g1_i1.p1  ORF type:complete len:601 (-),score=64.22 TRINITY_DN120887_c0_g1_i1:84-1886(-)
MLEVLVVVTPLIIGFTLLVSLWSLRTWSFEGGGDGADLPVAIPAGSVLPENSAEEDAMQTGSVDSQTACWRCAVLWGVHLSFLILLLIQAIPCECNAAVSLRLVLSSVIASSSALLAGQKVKMRSQRSLDLCLIAFTVAIGCLFLCIENSMLFLLMSGLSSTVVTCLGAVSSSMKVSSVALWLLTMLKVASLLRHIQGWPPTVPDDDVVGSRYVLAIFALLLEFGTVLWNTLLLACWKQLGQTLSSDCHSTPAANRGEPGDIEHGSCAPEKDFPLTQCVLLSAKEVSIQTDPAEWQGRSAPARDSPADHAREPEVGQRSGLAGAIAPPVDSPRKDVSLTTFGPAQVAPCTKDRTCARSVCEAHHGSSAEGAASCACSKQTGSRGQQPVRTDATLSEQQPAAKASLTRLRCHTQAQNFELAHSDETGSKLRVADSGVEAAPAAGAYDCQDAGGEQVSSVPICASCMSLRSSIDKVHGCMITVDARTDELTVSALQLMWRQPCGGTDRLELLQLCNLVDVDDVLDFQEWLARSITRILRGERNRAFPDLRLRLPGLGSIVAARAFLCMKAAHDDIQEAGDRFYIHLDCIQGYVQPNGRNLLA